MISDQVALYHQVSSECGKLVTKRYSTSFSLGIRFLSTKFHSAIYGIYGFVRLADEIVDTFLEQDKLLLLHEFKEDTYKAIERKVSMNPVLDAFQAVVNKYNIEPELIDAFLESMEMDIDFSKYHSGLYHKYIYGSAEVVGLMCLRVFCNGNNEQYESLRPAACSLGAAFQKVNFLRDMQSDFEERGRVYFPEVSFETFNESDKLAIEKDIEHDFEKALDGIRNLPAGAKPGVYLAYVYYKKLFNKIKLAKPSVVKRTRIRIPDFHKLYLLSISYFEYQLRLISWIQV